MQTSPRTKLGIILVALLVVVGLGWGISYYLSLQSVTLTFDTAVVDKLTLYKTVKEGTTIPAGKPVQDFVSAKTYHLAKGSYLLRPAGDKVSTSDIPFTIGDTAINKTLAIDYSPSYLSQVLTTELPTITKVINATNPQITKLYKINTGQLYHQGDWYGTILTYTGPDKINGDSLRLLAHNDNGNWVLVTKTPAITLPGSDYPAVPHDILTKINAIDPGLPAIVPPSTTPTKG